MTDTTQKAKAIRMLVLDVDGILTDGRIYYGNQGEELKAFSIKDGLGIKLLQRSGVTVAIITGRQSDIVTRRAKELGINEIAQGREDKYQALQELCERTDITIEQCAYMGDDLPDLSAIVASGLGLTVADACATVRESADWESAAAGGCGAVREACEFILSAKGMLDALESEFR